jgi:hypothetical protein
MALVQNEPLSFAVPASAGSFVLETVLAKFVLHEEIGMRRAAAGNTDFSLSLTAVRDVPEAPLTPDNQASRGVGTRHAGVHAPRSSICLFF